MPREVYLVPSSRGVRAWVSINSPRAELRPHQLPLVLVAPAENATDESDDDCYDKVHWVWCPPFCFVLGVTTHR